jgi:high-affinity nickel permease
MIDFVSIIALGFFLGMRHATDPDHVIAVTTIVARHKSMKHAAWIGALWGAGHTLTILAVGGGIILLGWVIPARVGLSMEFSVGLMLILLGIMNLTGIMEWINTNLGPETAVRETVHSHAHAHGDYIHAHPHGHTAETHSHNPQRTPLSKMDRTFGQIGVYQLVRPLVVGLVHGLAGSAAVALLVLTTIHEPRWAIAYLLVFGVGTIAGMMLITSVISLPIAAAGKLSVRVNSGLRLASGLLSLGFGVFLVYQIGIQGGLFTGHPHWTPR